MAWASLLQSLEPLVAGCSPFKSWRTKSLMKNVNELAIPPLISANYISVLQKKLINIDFLLKKNVSL